MRIQILVVLLFSLLSLSLAAVTPLNQTNIQNLLDAHNNARANVNPAAISPINQVVWDTTVAASAEANVMRCNFTHQSGDYGENLAGGSAGNFPTPGWENSVVTSWVSEKVSYDIYNTTSPCNDTQSFCLHYTQVVWNNSLRIGCARADGCSGGVSTIISCQYDPPGNFNNQIPYRPVSQAVGSTVSALTQAASGGLSSLPSLDVTKTAVASAGNQSQTPVASPVGQSQTPIASPVGQSQTPIASPVGQSQTPVASPIGQSQTPVASPVGQSQTPVASPIGQSQTPVASPIGQSQTPIPSNIAGSSQAGQSAQQSASQVVASSQAGQSAVVASSAVVQQTKTQTGSQSSTPSNTLQVPSGSQASNSQAVQSQGVSRSATKGVANSRPSKPQRVICRQACQQAFKACKRSSGFRACKQAKKDCVAACIAPQ